MADLKSELSMRNPYWLPRHRYLELRHYCLQYPEWKKLYVSLEPRLAEHLYFGKSEPSDPTATLAVLRAECAKAIELVDQCCVEAFPELSDILQNGVTLGRSYDCTDAMERVGCGREMYYERYRKFFYILSQRRGI